MTEQDEAAKLLNEYSDSPVSIMFLPKDMFDRRVNAQWIGQETLQSLRDIIDLIIARADDHAGYRVLVHTGEKDEFLEQNVIDKLLDYVRAGKKSVLKG